MRFRFAIATIIPVSVGAFATGAAAQTKLYLGEYKFNDPKLYVMEPGGANLQELSIIPTADWLIVGLQVDGSAEKIYWTHGSFNQGAIRRANLDGMGMETLVSSLTNPRGLAIDVAGGFLYWSDTQDNRMYRAPIDGGAPQTIIDTGHQLGRPTLDVVNGKIYHGNYGAGDMRRADLNGSDQEILFSGLFTPSQVALDLANGKIYWADSNTSFVSNHIVRANLDGTDREVLYEGLPTSSGFTGIGLDLAAGKLYWCDEITAAEKGMWEANLDGTSAKRIYESPRGWNAGAMTMVVEAADCPADLNGDNTVDAADLAMLLGNWGACGGCDEDINGDGSVDANDLALLLGSWGPCR